MEIIQQLAAELGLKPQQVENTVRLLDEGNTIPFIARYRKEATGELDETVLRTLAERLDYLRSLQNRKAEITRLIEAQGKLTPEISSSIQAAASLQELEDLYRPFRPKRKTRASVAKEKGLEPLAELLLAQQAEDPRHLAAPFLSDEVASVEEALQGAQDILAEQFADDPAHRALIRKFIYDTGLLVTERTDEDIPEADEFKMYFDYVEDAAKIPPHRVLAINRGERLGVL
ncbi:MAG TPA: RNA-binding transcriptional accessory protein, partial [Firmicutes bacterium]|nr:RNA-binding transcriptional accessory protein [Bacillota bacterium]